MVFRCPYCNIVMHEPNKPEEKELVVFHIMHFHPMEFYRKMKDVVNASLRDPIN